MGTGSGLWRHMQTFMSPLSGSILPVLKAGLSPIIIPREQRKAYIDTLSEYHYAAGLLRKGDELLPEQNELESFTSLCEQTWKNSFSLVDEIHQKQRVRNNKRIR